MTTAEPVPRWRRVLACLRYSIAVVLLLLLVLGVIGQVVRDRTLWLGWLFFLPLAPLAAVALLFDLASLGRALPWKRFVLTLAAVPALLVALAVGCETGTAQAAPEGARTVRLVQWNLKWGGLRGGGNRTEATWGAITTRLDELEPDMVVLSEAPPRFDPDEARMAEGRRWLATLLEHKGWSSAMAEHKPDSPWWYRLVVASRWPVRKEGEFAVFNGHVLAAIVDGPGRPLRVWVVDGQSNVAQVPRTPMLRELAERLEQSAARGEPVDIVAGDFNSPARCVAFDAWDEAGGGYQRVSRTAVGWRATWPRQAPLWDIDHVWLRRGLSPLSCEIFHTSASDHRGQLVRFAVAPAE